MSSSDRPAGAIEISGNPVERVEIVIANRLEELARVAGDVDRLVARHGLPADVGADLNVALDEVLANVLEHAYDDAGAHQIRIALCVYPQAVLAEIEDDGRPFDPLGAPPPDRAASLAESRIGGLGIHFLRSLMSEVTYRREDGKNRLTLAKVFGAAR
jgi:anti-sigma regulatory factor (Ser/Thr protein kinase)